MAGAPPAGGAARSGLLHAFEYIYEEHSATVYRTALGVLRDPVNAQDVTQDVFARLWRRPERFDSDRGTLVNYLRLMARSRALDLWRENQIAGRACTRMKVLAKGDEGRSDDRPARAVELRRDRAIVQSEVARLPPAQRQVIVMAYWGGMTAEQIAAATATPVGTVKSRMRLGIKKLRERCEPQLDHQALRAA